MSHPAPQAIDALPPSGVSSVGPAALVFEVRPYRPSDIAYVRDSWLRSGWDLENIRLRAEGVKSKHRRLAGHAWYALNRKQVTHYIEHGPVKVLVAVDRTDPDHIAGWIAYLEGGSAMVGSAMDRPQRSFMAGSVKHAYRKNDRGESWGVYELLANAAGVEWQCRST